jgi:hypothetical protein
LHYNSVPRPAGAGRRTGQGILPDDPPAGSVAAGAGHPDRVVNPVGYQT